MRPTYLAFLTAAAVAPAFGQTAAPAVATPSTYDQIWSAAVLYKGAATDVVNEVRLTGRQHIDWYQFRNGSEQDSDFVSRRTRLGLKAQVLKDFTVHVEADLNLEVPHPLFNKYTDAYVKWAPSKELAFIVGKQSIRYTLDGGTSSNSLVTIDRSPLAANLGFSEEYLPGVTAEGESGLWSWRAGFFSSGAADRDFGAFNGGLISFASVSRDITAISGFAKSSLRLDYFHQTNDAQNVIGTPKAFSRNFKQGFSLISQNTQGAWTFDGEIGLTDGQATPIIFAPRAAPSTPILPHLKALQLQSTYSFNKDWQAVARYTRVTSTNNNGVNFARYESLLNFGKGDRLEEYYFGLNRYFYGHKLKFQLGAQHSKMVDSANDGGAYAGWGFTTGLRVSW